MKGEKIMKRLIIICAFLAVTLAGSGYCAGAIAVGDLSKGADGNESQGGREQTEKMRYENCFAIIAKVLRLSNAQQAKITEILNAEHEEHAALLKQLAENRKFFREKTHAATFDEAEVRAIAENQGKLISKMIISPAIVRNKIRTLLTSEQRDLDERIQPLLEQDPRRRPLFAGGEPLPFMERGMEHRPPMMDEENQSLMKEGPPFCVEY
jgi:Spy/CpxP family protein refolding chaperone